MMTIEEAMCYLHNPEDEDYYNAKEVEAYKMIIKALEQEPCDTKELEKVRQELLERGDETISFHDLVERFDKIDKEYNGQLWNLLQIYSNINILIGKEPCDDAISRESVLRLFATHDGKYLYKAIQELPSVQPKYADKEMIKVLNKIRVEIKALPNANPSHWYSGDMVEREDVLEIIDEYEAESEG